MTANSPMFSTVRFSTTSSEAVSSCTFFSTYEDERCHLISWKKRKRKKMRQVFRPRFWLTSIAQRLQIQKLIACPNQPINSHPAPQPPRDDGITHYYVRCE